MQVVNRAGQTYGRLTVLSREPNRPESGTARWLCSCSCGGSVVVDANSLRGGTTKSCGCLVKEGLLARNKGNKHSQTHGLSAHPLYPVWKGMWRRCTDSTHRNFDLYKDRTPPDSWKDFEQFVRDMGPRPLRATLERIKNELPYGPGNCKWASLTENNRNRNTTVYVTHNGVSKPLAEWAELTGLPYSTLYYRFKKNLRGEALFKPQGL